MGKSCSRCCNCCFGQSELAEVDDSVVRMSKLSTPLIQDTTQIASLSEEDQRLVSQVNNSVDLFFTLINTPATADPALELIVEKQHLRVYGKDTPRGFLLRSEWLMPYRPSEFISFLGDVELRLTWDRKMESVRCLRSILGEYGVYYQTYRKIMLLAQRDLLYVSKTFQSGDAWVDICTSVDLAEVPGTKDVVRMRLFLGGYFAEPLPVPEGDLISRVVCVSECDFGGSVPRAIVKKVSAITIPSYVKEIEDALKSHLIS